MLVLQNCMDLEKRISGPCSETYPTSSHDVNLDMNIKAEAVSDIEVEEEHPVPMTFIGIKAEHEVSSLCPLFGRFLARLELPRLSQLQLSVDAALVNRFLRALFGMWRLDCFPLHIACGVTFPICLKEICMKLYLE
jgi:hypothetical protein